MTTQTKILTQEQAVDLVEILNLIGKGAKIKWLDGEDIRTGVIRHRVVGPDNFYFPSRDEDVRDSYVRITDWGTEHVLPIMKMVDLYSKGMLAEDKK